MLEQASNKASGIGAVGAILDKCPRGRVGRGRKLIRWLVCRAFPATVTLNTSLSLEMEPYCTGDIDYTPSLLFGVWPLPSQLTCPYMDSLEKLAWSHSRNLSI